MGFVKTVFGDFRVTSRLLDLRIFIRFTFIRISEVQNGSTRT
jgi:hypothetical protein